MALPKRRLGNDLEVTALGYGAMGLEGSYGAELDRSEAAAFIRATFERGVTMFDTAEAYRRSATRS